MNTIDHNYPKSALYGGVLGYTAKYAIPLLKHEKGAEFGEFMKQFEDYSTTIKNTRLAELRSGTIKHPGAGIYLDIMSVGEKSPEGIVKFNKLSGNEKAWFKNLKNEIERELQAPLKAGEKVFGSIRKAIRPTAAFIAIGATTALIIDALFKKNKSKA